MAAWHLSNISGMMYLCVELLSNVRHKCSFVVLHVDTNAMRAIPFFQHNFKHGLSGDHKDAFEDSCAQSYVACRKVQLNLAQT
jgi:hypothetical protein